MQTLKRSERITLADGLQLLLPYLPAEQAKDRLRQAFVHKAFSQAPLYACPYDEAEIDWETGTVKIPRERERFCPTFSRKEFEEYFGLIPEPSPSLPTRFSRRTVIAAIEVFEQFTHAGLSRFVLKLGPNLLQQVGSPPLSISTRLNNLIGIIDQSPVQVLDNGELLRDVIVEKAVDLLPPSEPDNPRTELENQSSLYANAAALLRALERDGFTVTDGKLRRSLPIDISLPTTQSEVDRLLDKHGFSVPKGQLAQAIDAHARGKWAGANGQFRPFFEGLLDEMAARIAPGDGEAVRRLLKAGFLRRDLNERDLVDGLMKRLHPQGPHPGLSGDEDSTYRFHVVLLTARLFLTRFDNWSNL